MFTLSVIICTYKRYEILDLAIDSELGLIKKNKNISILVVDNNPDEFYQANFYKKYSGNKNFKVERCLELGLSNARNKGLNLVDPDFITYIDDDAIFSPSWFEGIESAVISDKDIGVIGGPVKPIWPKSGRPKWLPDSCLGFLTVLDLGDQIRKISKNEYFCGTNITFKTRYLKEVGGFNSSLGRLGNVLLSNEELQVTHKIMGLGGTAVYSPSALVMHRVHEDRISRSWLRKRIAWQAISDVFMNPEAINSDKLKYESMHQFLKRVPPGNRGLNALFDNYDDQIINEHQFRAIEDLVYKALVRPESYE